MKRLYSPTTTVLAPSIASIRGVAKAGFAVMSGEIKQDVWKRFVYVTEN